MKARFPYYLLATLVVMSMLLGACAQATPTTAPAADQPAAPTQGDAPAAPAAEQTTITFWHGYNADVEAKFLDETLIPDFEALHPDINVESLVVPYDQFRRKLLIAMSGGEAPDLARIDIIWVPELADTGALAKLNEILPDFQALADQMLPGPLSTNFFNGNYYGLPLDTNTRVMAYNEAVFAAAGIENAPVTIDEFLEDCEKIKALGDDTYCFADGGTYAWATNPWIWSFGGDVTDPEVTKSTGFFNSEATAAAYNFLKDSIDKGYINPSMKGGRPGKTTRSIFFGLLQPFCVVSACRGRIAPALAKSGILASS